METISHQLWVAPGKTAAGKQPLKGLAVKGCLLAALQQLVLKVLHGGGGDLGGTSRVYCKMYSLLIIYL